MRYAYVFLIIAALGACSTIVESPEKRAFREQMEKWVGRPVDDLVAVNGPPADIVMLDSGARVFEYVHKQEQKVAKQKKPETQTVYRSSGVARSVQLGAKMDRAREMESLGELAPEVPVAEGSLSWQMDQSKQYTQYSHRKIHLGCNVVFNVSASNIIERWSMEGSQCD